MQYTQQQQQAYQAYIAQGYDQTTALNAALASYPSVPVAQVPVAIAPMQVQTQPALLPTSQADAVNSILGIANEVATEEDHGSISDGFIARAGQAWLRILGYIEVGIHEPSNPTYTAKQVAYLIVEMHHPDHAKADGSPTIERIRISKTHSGNSAFPKLFKHLSSCFPNENITHMGQLIGRALLATVYHSKDKKDKVWANFNKDAAWSFVPTSGSNPDGSQYNVVVPELVNKPVLFLYDCPKTLANPIHMKAMWDSIYIEGVRKWKDKTTGEEQEYSNNNWQELLVKSTKWATSETKAVLTSIGCDTVLGIAPKAPALAQPSMQPVMQPALAQPVMQPALVQQAAVYRTAAPVQQASAAPVQQAVAIEQPMLAPVAEQQAVTTFNQAVAQTPLPAPAMLDPNLFTQAYY